MLSYELVLGGLFVIAIATPAWQEVVNEQVSKNLVSSAVLFNNVNPMPLITNVVTGIKAGLHTVLLYRAEVKRYPFRPHEFSARSLT